MKIPIINMILFFVAIQAAMVLIALPNLDNSATLMTDGSNASTYGSNASFGGVATTSAVIWDTILFPQKGTNGTFFVYLLGFALLITAIALVARIDTGVWSGIFLILLGFGALPILNLYNFINSEVANFACSITPTLLGTVPICWPAEFISMLVCGILSIFWVWGCISWWSNRYD